VEIMIVIAVLGILAALVVPHYMDVQETAEEAAVLRQLQVVRGQLSVYRSENDGTDPIMTNWQGLISADLIVAAPANALNKRKDVKAAGDFTGGWVWRDNGAGRMQIYATNAAHSGEFVE
jgi:type II secretory pathway pseudopilin PulG